jgi:hypothetical protein
MMMQVRRTGTQVPELKYEEYEAFLLIPDHFVVSDF